MTNEGTRGYIFMSSNFRVFVGTNKTFAVLRNALFELKCQSYNMCWKIIVSLREPIIYDVAEIILTSMNNVDINYYSRISCSLLIKREYCRRNVFTQRFYVGTL